jgi:hypothetical protein
MHVCHCVAACKGCGQCCRSGHLPWCPLMNYKPPVQPPLPFTVYTVPGSYVQDIR